jgi:hypothetical protein
MRSEVQKFQDDLLASVKQMRRGRAARVTKVQLPAAAEARASVGLSQQEFASCWVYLRERFKTGSRGAENRRVRHARC